MSALHLDHYDERKNLMAHAISDQDIESLSKMEKLVNVLAQRQDANGKLQVATDEQAESRARAEMQASLQTLRAEFETDLRNSLYQLEQHAAAQVRRT